MTKLNFHKNKNFFMDWLMLNEMSTGEIALWHTLMNIGNRLGQKCAFNAPTSSVMKFTGLSKQGVINARKKLMERGFISYKKGHQNKAPVYEMISLHKAIENYFPFGENTELTIGLTQNLTPQLTQDLSDDLTIHKVQNTKEKRRGGSGSLMPSLYKTYEENIDKPTPLIKKELLKWIDDVGEDVVEEAITITVKKGGKTFSYMEKILQQWKRVGIQSLAEVHAYELERELEKKSKLIPFRKQNTRAFQEESLDEWLKEEF